MFRVRTSRSDRRRHQRGFTLIELGVVLAILAILVAIAVPTYAAMVRRAREAEARQAWTMVKTELWSYFLEHNEFPAANQDGTGWDEIDAIPASDYWNYAASTDQANNEATLKATGKEPGSESHKICWTLHDDGTVDEERGADCP